MNKKKKLSKKLPPKTKILKYSKSSSFYLNIKKNFYLDNDELLQGCIKVNKSYAATPKRKFCKICKIFLPKKIDFVSHGVEYIFCLKCTHLNGKFEDTKKFVDDLYISEKNESGLNNAYIDKSFLERVNSIYTPKIDFLINNISLDKYRILDVGCGAGFFVMAGLLKKLDISGCDISKKLIDFGNKQNFIQTKVKPLKFVDENEFMNEIIYSNANIISAINVLEHLREPHKFFSAFKKSKAQYLYYSVPMFSFSVVVENVFKNVFPRLLSRGHTHLFTEHSLKKMNKTLGVRPIAEWRFGTDIVDLHRSIIVNLRKNNSSEKFIDYMEKGFGEKKDEIQSIFDKNHFCSQIHCIVSKV